MTPVLADITKPIPPALADSGYPTGVLLSPVFVEGGARRRRLLTRWGYLLAAACLTYLVMLGVSLTASPASKPGSAAKPAPSLTDVGALTTPTPPPARAVPTTKAVVDGDAAQDAALFLHVAAPLTTRLALPRPTTMTRATTPRTRSPRDNDNPPTTHPATISTTPLAPSKTASPTSAPKRRAS
jgi:hypothetical protein